MRSWNFLFLWWKYRKIQDLSLPMRNWNKNILLFLFFLFFDLSLPMRNWNLFGNLFYYFKEFDLSLPMRNWNYLHQLHYNKTQDRFEPTYEELKLELFKKYRTSVGVIWAYLWGIETSAPHHKEEIQKEDLSLPMRNWNGKEIFTKHARPMDLSLPMRNWNNHLTSYTIHHQHGFEPTYDELKHKIHVSPPIKFNLIWAYLWGIETFLLSIFLFFLISIWAYLWGIETSVSLLKVLSEE